ncbi:MAG: hypothetical protein QM736_04055 [Vicinamibacterales bacterium]
MTSGLSNSSYGINLPNTNPFAAGLPSIAITGFFTSRRSAAAVRRAHQRRLAVHG